MRRSWVLLVLWGGCADDPALADADTTVATSSDDVATSSSPSTSAGADETSGGMIVRYHPMGFSLPAMHGPAAKLGEEDCRECHGSDLAGGEAISCDSCHEAGWRTDCTFCHGGNETDLGAPPRPLDPAGPAPAFDVHTAHVTEGDHAAFDCTHCHVKPTSVTSLAHMFDDTPGVAEVDFTHGLSPAGTYAAGTCAELYCHGTGNGQLGQMQASEVAPGCDGCHGYTGPSAVPVSTMSGRHALHMNAGIGCESCHAATTESLASILQPLLHVDGYAEVVSSEVNYDANTGACSGLCHLEAHFAEHW